MATLTLLDFSSGDCELSIDLYCETLTSREAEAKLLALPDDVGLVGVVSYCFGTVGSFEGDGRVGDLRTWEHGWWGW